MRAFVLDAYGQPLHIAEVPEPTLGDDMVLIETAASSVNQLDLKIAAGEFKQILPYPLPHALGHDVAGTVVEVGSAVTGFKAGDAVYSRVGRSEVGTFAGRVVARESDVALRPATVTAAEAASLPLVALTAWQALVARGNVRPGQRVLIHAGAGGVGSIAIQLAKYLGAEVVTTASAGNADFVHGLGADTVVDYRAQRFEDVVSDVDLVLDSLGGDNLARSLTVLRTGGKAIGIAGPPDPAFAKRAGLNFVMRMAIAGMGRKVRRQAAALGVTYEFLFMEPDGGQLGTIAGLVDDGTLRPVVGAVYPFEKTVEAMNALSRGGLRGKVVIDHS